MTPFIWSKELYKSKQYVLRNTNIDDMTKRIAQKWFAQTQECMYLEEGDVDISLGKDTQAIYEVIIMVLFLN